MAKILLFFFLIYKNPRHKKKNFFSSSSPPHLPCWPCIVGSSRHLACLLPSSPLYAYQSVLVQVYLELHIGPLFTTTRQTGCVHMLQRLHLLHRVLSCYQRTGATASCSMQPACTYSDTIPHLFSDRFPARCTSDIRAFTPVPCVWPMMRKQHTAHTIHSVHTYSYIQTSHDSTRNNRAAMHASSLLPSPKRPCFPAEG